MAQIKTTVNLGPAPIRLTAREGSAGPSAMAIGAGVAITAAMVAFLLFV